MELRAIRKRNRDETIRARKAGEPKQRRSYGYMFIRLAPTAKVDHVTLDPGDGIPSTASVPMVIFPVSAQLYGRPVKGGPWTGHTLKHNHVQ